jgi:hypothetical protein
MDGLGQSPRPFARDPGAELADRAARGDAGAVERVATASTL